MKPNILFLFPDQHRGDWLPYPKEIMDSMGMDELPIKMPNLKKIMQNGVSFTNAITPSPLCAPARACLAAGKRYENCRVPGNNFDYPLDMPTVYSSMKAAGYSVGGVGKFDVHKKTMFWGLDGWIDDLGTMGFTHGIDNAGKIDSGTSAKIKPQDPYMATLERHGYREYHVGNILTRKHSVEPTELPDELYCDNWIAKNATDMIKEFPADKPWFLQINFTGPHDPWDVTKSMRMRWKDKKFPEPCCYPGDAAYVPDLQGIRQNYAAMLENIDARIGDILKVIEEKGQLNNTVIVYSSDHGEMMGDFGKFGKMVQQRGSIHIPMIISAPNMKKTGYDDSLTELQDLTQTFAEIAGTELATAEDSISLYPVIEGGKIAGRGVQQSAIKNWKVLQNKEYKAVYIDDELTEVYDRLSDVWETDNIMNRNSEEGRAIESKILSER